MTWLFIVIFILLAGSAPVSGESDERTALMKDRQQLQTRIGVLRAEQQYLLFQNAMYGSDSKYLVFKRTRNLILLKYKNRTLKDVPFKVLGKRRSAGLNPGLLVLTVKTEGTRGRYALVFGKSLIVQGKRPAAPPDAGKTPVISIPQKDMVSIFFALEAGSMGYIEP